jgi:hypothetical protein
MKCRWRVHVRASPLPIKGGMNLSDCGIRRGAKGVGTDHHDQGLHSRR